MSLITVKNLAVSYGANVVLRDVSLTLEKGEIVTIVGPNGSGKTTAIKTLLGLCRRNGGALSVLGSGLRCWSVASIKSR